MKKETSSSLQQRQKRWKKMSLSLQQRQRRPKKDTQAYAIPIHSTKTEEVEEGYERRRHSIHLTKTQETEEGEDVPTSLTRDWRKRQGKSTSSLHQSRKWRRSCLDSKDDKKRRHSHPFYIDRRPEKTIPPPYKNREQWRSWLKLAKEVTPTPSTE